MIKTIAAKIIVSYFGKFIKGVSKQNLDVSLIGGSAKLVNIAINDQLFQDTGLPIELAYSSIGKLDLQMSPSKLGSTPVECTLEDVFMIFKFKDKAFVDLDKGDLQKTKQAVEEYAKECLEKFKSRLESKKDDGMFAKIGKKIIDNLQLKIVNLHIRFQENGTDKKYAWGVSLEQIHFVTTNDKWQQAFIDRSLEANKNVILFKKMQVKNLGVYWNSDQVEYLASSKERAAQEMKSVVYSSRDRIINISSEFQLRINPLNQFETSVYQMTVSLSPIDIEMQQTQLSQIIDFMERIVVHNELKYMFKKKAEKNEDIEHMHQLFKDYMRAYLQDDSHSDQQASKALYKLPLDQLMIWTIAQVKLFVRKYKLDQLEKQKKGGWFSSGAEITKEEISSLEQEIQNAFQQQTQSLRPPSCPFYQIQIIIPSGSFSFSQMKDNAREILKLTYSQLLFSAERSNDDSGLNLQTKLSSISLNFFQAESVYSIIQNLSSDNQNFLELTHKKKLDKDVQLFQTTLKVQQLVCVYRYLFVKKFRQFFTFRSVDEILKSLTLEKIENIQTEKQQERLIEQKTKIDASIKSPVLLIPFGNSEQSDCWACNLGNLKVVSEENSQDPDFRNYQFFSIKLEQVSLMYLPNMSVCYGQEATYKNASPLIQNINLIMQLKQRRLFVDDKVCYKDIMSITLDKFTFKFTHKQYGHLMQLISILKQGKKSRLEELKKQKDKMESIKVFEGKVRKQNNLLKNWTDCHAVLSGPYIYFYLDRRDLKAESSVFIKNSKVQFNGPNLEITNKYEQCTLTGNNSELEDWKLAIEDQVKKYATNVQFFDMYAEPEQKPIAKKEYHKKHAFRFNLGVFDCHYQDQHNKLLASFNLIGLKLDNTSDTDQDKTVLEFSSFGISDRVFEYANPDNQVFIGVKGATDSPLVTITKLKGSETGKAQGQRLNVLMRLPVLVLNWKPDVILLLVGLSKKHLDKQEMLRENDFEMRVTGLKLDRQRILKDLKDNNEFQSMDSNHNKSEREVKNQRDKYLKLEGYQELNGSKHPILFSFDWDIGVLEGQLFHRQSHVLMFRLSAQNIFGNILFTEDQKFLEGGFSQLQLYQMFNYPQTKDSNLQFQSITPNLVLGRKGNYQEPLVKFRWSSYKQQTFFNKQRVNGFLLLSFNPVNFNYAQQVTFRAIDYCLIQIILLLTNPDQVVANEGLLEQLKNNSQKHQEIVFVWGQYQQIAKKLLSPFFFDILIQLKEPTIILMAEPNVSVHFKLQAKQVRLSNSTYKRRQRFAVETNVHADLVNSIWEEEYSLVAQEMELKIIQKGAEKDLWLPTSLKMNINRLLNEDQIRYIFPEVLVYDRGFKITSSSDQVKLNLNKLEYLQVLKLLNFNITYEDQRDELFIHNYKITKLLSPKPIDFRLNIPSLLFTADFLVDSDIDTLFILGFSQLDVEYRRTKQLNSSVSLITPSIVLSSSKDGVDIPIVKAPEEIQKKEPIRLDVDMKPTGDKIVSLYMESAKMVLKIQFYQLVLEWALVEDWIFPVQSSHVLPILFMTNINRVIICLEPEAQQGSKHGFAALGTLSFKFTRKRNRTEEWYTQQLVNKMMTPEEFDLRSQVSLMSVSLNIEICRCKYDDFLSTPFDKVNKRTIVYPLTLNYGDLNSRTLSDYKTLAFNNTSKKSVNADKASCKIATKDIMLLGDLWAMQFNENPVMIRAMNSIKEVKSQIACQPKKDSNEISTLATLEVSVSCISIVLINNYKDSFIPLINPIVQNFNMTLISTYKKSILELRFQIVMNYFNGQLLKWEPILERVTLSLNHSNYFQSNKRIMSAETKQNIRFSINKECIHALSSSAAQWKNTSREPPKADEPVQFISHYILVNQTGYPIDIYNRKGQIKNKINSDQEQSYGIEIGDNSQSDENTSVTIIIKHPKYEYDSLKEIQLNSNKVRRIGTINKRELNKNITLVVRPKYEDLKQYIYISGVYTILDHTRDKPTHFTMPFDQNLSHFKLGEPHNIELSLERLREPIQTKLYRYTLERKSKDKMSVIHINYRNTATNLLPIPIDINGQQVNPNRSVGFTGELMLQGIKHTTTKTLKTFAYKNQVTVYCEAYIVDYYGLDIAYDTLTEIKPINPKYTCQQKLKNGEANIVLIYSPKEKLVFRLKNRKHYSKPFTPTLGRSWFRIIQGISEMEFVVVTRIKTINDHRGERLVTIIQIAPKYIIVNSSQHRLKISQADSVQSTVLDHGQREPFFWENAKKPKYIKICSFDDKSMWGYSGPIDLNQDFHCFYLRKAEDIKQAKIFMVQLQRTSHVTYVNITHADSPFRIENELKNVQMLVCQAEIFKSQQILNPNQIITQVRSGQNIPFAYEFPSADKGLIVSLRFPVESDMQCQTIRVDLDKQLTEQKILVYKNKKPVGYYLLVMEFQGNAKKLKLTDKKRQVLQQQPHKEVNIKLPQLSLSFIGCEQNTRKQLLFFTFEHIEATMTNTNKDIEYSLFIKNCRIESQRSAKPLFPVMLHATAQPYLQFALVKDNDNSKLIHYIGLSINKSAISLTSDEFAILHENINLMTEGVTGSNVLDEAVTDHDFYRRTMNQRAESYYFMKAQIHPFECKLNFKNIGDIGGHVGKTFTSVSNSTVRADGILLRHFSCKDIGDFMSTVVDIYKENIVSTVLPMIGNISILGNPASLFTSIGSGFKDLVTLPAKGFEIGPLEGAQGLGKGIKSLFQKTVTGTFNSVQAIGDTIGTGLASLTFDDTFQRQRDRIRNKRSQDVLDGLLNGGKSLLNGIGDGFLGLVRNPYQGAEKNGIGGFFVGAAKGVAGVVLKPLSGLVDFTAKTAQGIKNTSQSMSPSISNTRQHFPRVFYTPNREYRAYDHVLAQINNMIQVSDPQKYANLSWCNGFQVARHSFLALTYEYMIFFNLEKYQIVKEFQSKMVIGCKQLEEPKRSKGSVSGAVSGSGQMDYFVLFLINKRQNQNGELRIPVEKKSLARDIVNSVKQVIAYHHSA